MKKCCVIGSSIPVSQELSSQESVNHGTTPVLGAGDGVLKRASKSFDLTILKGSQASVKVSLFGSSSPGSCVWPLLPQKSSSHVVQQVSASGVLGDSQRLGFIVGSCGKGGLGRDTHVVDDDA